MTSGEKAVYLECLDVHEDVYSLHPPIGSLIEVRTRVDLEAGEHGQCERDEQSDGKLSNGEGGFARGKKRKCSTDEAWLPGSENNKPKAKKDSFSRNSRRKASRSTVKRRTVQQNFGSRARDGVLDEDKRCGPENSFGWNAPEDVVWWIARVESHGHNGEGMLLKYSRFCDKHEFISKVGQGEDAFDSSDAEYEVTVRFECEEQPNSGGGGLSVPSLYLQDVSNDDEHRRYRTASNDVANAYENRPCLCVLDSSDEAPGSLAISREDRLRDFDDLQAKVDGLGEVIQGLQSKVHRMAGSAVNVIPQVVHVRAVERLRMFGFDRVGKFLTSSRLTLSSEVQKKLRSCSRSGGDEQVEYSGHSVMICDYSYGEFVRLSDELIAQHSASSGRALLREPKTGDRNFVPVSGKLGVHYLLYTRFDDLTEDIGLNCRDRVPSLFYESSRKSMVIVGNVGRQGGAAVRVENTGTGSTSCSGECNGSPARDVADISPYPGSRFVSIGMSLANLTRQVSSRTECDWRVHCLEMTESEEVGPGCENKMEFKGISVDPVSLSTSRNVPESNNYSQPMGLKWQPLCGGSISNVLRADQVPGVLYAVFPLVLVRTDLLSTSALKYMQSVKLA